MEIRKAVRSSNQATLGILRNVFNRTGHVGARLMVREVPSVSKLPAGNDLCSPVPRIPTVSPKLEECFLLLPDPSDPSQVSSVFRWPRPPRPSQRVLTARSLGAPLLRFPPLG